MFSRLTQHPSDQSFFLLGPRGTGKTTWVKTAFPGAIYIDLLEDRLFNDLLADPQRLEEFIPPDYNDWVIIDEIQRIPLLLYEVHRLIENRKIKFVLTGSSARKLRKKGVNLLGGRAQTRFFYPLTGLETGKKFNLKHALDFGQLPSVYFKEDPQRYLESYVKTYLEEEIRQEGLTRNLGAFARFLEAASFSVGNMLNISEVARECAIERKVVENYFTILEDLMIAYRIPVFTKKAKRRMVQHPKFYFFDVGLFRTLRPLGSLDAPEEIQGMALETLVLQELKAINEALGLNYKIFYWRTSNQEEVDFICYGPKGLKAIEIKRTQKLNSKHLSGLKAFKKDYPMAELYILYGGDKKMYLGDIHAIPLSQAINEGFRFLR